MAPLNHEADDEPMDPNELRSLGVEVVPPEDMNEVLDGALEEETIEILRQAVEA